MRKSKTHSKIYLPDPKFNDSLVTRFVNHIMKKGKKIKAYGIFYGAMNEIEKRKENIDKNALEIWKDALKNVMPHVEVKTIRRGGTNIQVPFIISNNVKLTKAIKILIKYSRERTEKTMIIKLALEIISASKEEGLAFKRKESIHKMAEANKAFSHLMISNNLSWQKS